MSHAAPDAESAGWTTARLADVTTKIGSGATPKGGEESYKETGIPLIRSLNVHDGVFRHKDLAFIDDTQAAKLDNVVVQAGDVLLNITGASIARCCVAPSELLPARVNQHVAIIRPVQNAISPRFLGHLLVCRDYKDRLLRTGDKAGATRQALTKAQLEAFEIRFPPLPEQKRIVAILDEAFAGIDAAVANAAKNLANARELFESYLNSVFTQRGEGWVEKAVGEIGVVQTGTTPKTADTGNYGDYIPFIKPGDFHGDGTLDYDNEGLSKQGIAGSRLFSRESVLMVCIGATIGKAGFTERDVCANQQINSLTPGPGVSAKFLYYQMLTPVFQAEVKKNAGQATLPIISKSKWSALSVWLPKTRSEQDGIVERLDALGASARALETQYNQKLAVLGQLRQSILHKAFTGELTNKPERAMREAAS